MSEYGDATDRTRLISRGFGSKTKTLPERTLPFRSATADGRFRHLGYGDGQSGTSNYPTPIWRPYGRTKNNKTNPPASETPPSCVVRGHRVGGSRFGRTGRVENVERAT